MGCINVLHFIYTKREKEKRRKGEKEKKEKEENKKTLVFVFPSYRRIGGELMLI